MMFGFASLALTFIGGFLVSLAIRFLFQRFDFDRRWLRKASSTMNPTLLGTGDSKNAPLNNVFPHPGNYPLVIPQGPPPHFGPTMLPAFGPVPPNLSPMFPQPPNPYSGESFGRFRRVHQQLNHKNMWEAHKPEPPPPNNLPFAFTAYYRHKPPHCVPSLQIMVEIHCDGLKKILKNCLQNVDSIFDSTPMIDIHKLFNQTDCLRAELSKLEALLADSDVESQATISPTKRDNDSQLQVSHLRELLSFIDEELQPVQQKMDALLSKDHITFDLLWRLFPEGSDVTFPDPRSGLTCAGKITSATYYGNETRPRSYPNSSPPQTFNIVARFIDYNGISFYTASHQIYFTFFNDIKDIGSLPAQPLSNGELKEQLIARGEKFMALKGKHYLEYSGFIAHQPAPSIGIHPVPPPMPAQPLPPQGMSNFLNFRATGRVMVDFLSFKKMVPNHWSQLSQPHPTHQLEGIPDNEVHLCAPTVLGYSFACKKWGRFDADKFSEIVWNTKAFDHLVLAEEKKLLIKSLVYADRAAMITDVISGKAGGSIVILHGKPGTGKTLTAEAAAEKGKRPLMVVAAAELASRATDLEDYLGNILEICEAWSAVLLIDEAEVYLEARSRGDVKRNAMVSVFLRLLEYHQQVIFLTTNHIGRIDSAFKSRTSVAIKYPELDKDARETIWTRFLKMAGVQILDNANGEPQSITKAELGKLVGRKMNGREIKNAVRTAQTRAALKKDPLNYALLTRVMEMATDFGDFEQTSGLKV